MKPVAGTRPYPWPYDDSLEARSLALVLAGWDEGWRGRALVDAAPECCALAGAVAAADGLVVAVAHGDAVPLEPPRGAIAVRAAGIDGFYGGGLDAVLRRRARTHLLVAGCGLEGPVHSTLRSANDRGFECLLVADAASPLTVDCVVGASSMVCMSGGIFGAVGDTGPVLDALEHLVSIVPGGTT